MLVSPLLAASLSPFADFRGVLLPLLLGAATLYLLLPRPQGRQVLLGALLGVIALVLGGFFVVRVGGVSVETVLFYIFSGLAVVAGTLLVTQHNPARAALSFALAILSVCGLFLLLAAPFLMAATIIIYAGAIVVTFLFVIMLAQQTGISDADLRSREPMLASLTGFILLGAMLYVLRLGFWGEVQPLDPFLDRLREATARESADDIAAVLKRNPEELDNALERIRAQGNRMKPENLASVLQADDSDFVTRLKLAFKLLDHKELTDRMDNNLLGFTLPTPGAAKAEEKAHAVVENCLALTLQARQRVGFGQSDQAAPMQSSFSGPPPGETAQLRRDEFGRPQTPAENSTYLGKSLFTDYLLPVEIGGFLLLVAAIGAIAIANRHNAPGRAS